MTLRLEPYRDQAARWPASGRHILAQCDDTSVVVYQAYRPEIGRFAARHGRFGGEFSFNRISWIKPNFLWMMYRSGWGTKPGQETTLVVRVRRDAFDAILAAAVHTSFVAEVYGTQAVWQNALLCSEVRVQWDPDHDPAGTPLARRAIQLGLRGDTLARYAGEWLLGIEDISELVASQRQHARAPFADLLTPAEQVYLIADHEVASRLGNV